MRIALETRIVLFSLLLAVSGGCTGPIDESETPEQMTAAALQEALLLHASFDKGPNADFARGDPKFYTAPSTWGEDAFQLREQARPGLSESGEVEIAPREGRYGGALRFNQKTNLHHFYRGEGNLNYRSQNWSGSASLWLKLDPDEDLDRICDPLQFVGQVWEVGNMFLEFTKDHTPRHIFQFVILPPTRLLNPEGHSVEEIPDQKRPIVRVDAPPFGRDRWTHVCFTFGNVNTGRKDAWGSLYLDGELQGTFSDLEATFDWDVAQSAITVGLFYVGLFDDLAIFDRPLSSEEVRLIYNLEGGIQEFYKSQ